MVNIKDSFEMHSVMCTRLMIISSDALLGLFSMATRVCIVIAAYIYLLKYP